MKSNTDFISSRIDASNACACEVACKQWHGIKAGTIKLRRVEVLQALSRMLPGHSFSFLQALRQSSVCGRLPQGAISKRIEDGIVVVDRSKCIGCRACLDACPFGIPQYDEDGTMRKCDMCLERMETGQKPICVATCPTQALKWGTMEELSDFAARKSARKMME